uniref:Uncharacterized protein n=1 Tax=Oryza barthii TaxID=65489 RepID=A0A0D3FY58_9ORYZ
MRVTVLGLAGCEASTRRRRGPIASRMAAHCGHTCTRAWTGRGTTELERYRAPWLDLFENLVLEG